jgi:hypothetical protein
MMTACSSTATVVARTLPAVDLVVPQPAPRPAITVGSDARLLARRALDYGDQNAARLEQARGAYGAIVQTYGVP